MCRLLAVFFYQQNVVTHKNKYHCLYFKATRGTKYGGLISPTLFNFIFNNVVQNCLALTVEEQLFSRGG